MCWKLALPTNDEKFLCNCIDRHDHYKTDTSKCYEKMPDGYRRNCLPLTSLRQPLNILLVCRRAFEEVGPSLPKSRAYQVCSNVCARKLISSIRGEKRDLAIESFDSYDRRNGSSTYDDGPVWHAIGKFQRPDYMVTQTPDGELIAYLRRFLCEFDHGDQQILGYRFVVTTEKRRVSGRAAKLPRVNYEEERVQDEVLLRPRKRTRRRA